MPVRRRTTGRKRRRAKQVSLPFPLATPTEGSYREPQYQQRIEMYAQNHFTPAEYQKIKSRGISFVRGDADMIRQAFIGEAGIKHKVQLFTGSAYVYDLAHALLLQVKRTVQQLVNVPEGLDIATLMAVLFNLRGYKLVRADGTEAKADVQLRALSTTDFKTMAERGTVTMDGGSYRPIRVPTDINQPGQTYPWSVTAAGEVAADCVVAQLMEICRSRTIPCDAFSMAQRAGVFAPLEIDTVQGSNSGSLMLDRGTGWGLGLETSDSTTGFYRPNVVTGPLPAGRFSRPSIGDGFSNIIRTIQLPNGGYGPTSVAGLDEVFTMERERDLIISMLTQWGTTGLGLIMDRQVPYNMYRSGTGGDAGQYGAALSDAEAVMGNRPAYAQFGEANGMGGTCGPGYHRVWYSGDLSDPKTKEVPGTIQVNGVEYRNPAASNAVCAPMTRQLRSMPYSRDVVTNPVMGIAAQRHHKRRRPSTKRRPKSRKTTGKRRY